MKQKNWPEWLASAEFIVNNKTHLATNIFSFMAKYRRELRIGVDIRRKEKMEKAIEFTERMKRIQEKMGAVLRKVQEEIKKQENKERKEIEERKKDDRMMLSTKDLVFKE